jgi:hypothetical protein
LRIVGWQHGFPAQRTTCAVLLHAAYEAMRVNGMPTRRNGCRFYRIKQILQADGAVGVEPFGLTPMIQRSNACATHVTVHKIIITLHTTNAAFIAMIIISLNSVIKKVAHGAKIVGKLNATPFI